MTTAAAPTGNLEITVSRAELLRELTAAQSVVERKTTIPILSNFLFEAADDTLTITATDLDQGLRTSCPAKVKKPGACTIPARKLYDYIKLLPEGDISIKLMDNHWVQIRAGRSNTKMVGMARANFPQVPEFPTTGAFKLSVASMQNMISKTIFAISNEESRYTLNGALLVLKAESMAMVATDGHRLAHIEKLGESLEGVSGEKKTLIPRKALSELLSLLNSTDAESLDFADDEQTLFFRVGGRVLTSRKLTGQFPNYEAVLPRDNNKFVIVRSEDLMGSIQRVAQFADERSGAIKIRLEQNESSCLPLRRTLASRKTPSRRPTTTTRWWSVSTASTSSTSSRPSAPPARCAWSSKTPSPLARCAPKTPPKTSSTAISSCP